MEIGELVQKLKGGLHRHTQRQQQEVDANKAAMP
jgi:hypothetical protein